jgi:carbonic anhydrase
MGHSRCGGIRAFVEYRERATGGDFIGKWMELIKPAAASVADADNLPRSEYLSRLERASIVATLGNLMTFPWIRDRVEQRQLQLVGACFHVRTGILDVYDPDTATFAPVEKVAVDQTSASASLDGSVL